MPGTPNTDEAMAIFEGGQDEGLMTKVVGRFMDRCDKHFDRTHKMSKYLADISKPNLIWEGNSGALVNNQVELLVYKVPVGLRLLISRLMILADALTPASGKYTNAGAYWQLFEGASRNQMSMPDFGPLDGSISGYSQIPMINQYGTKGLIISPGQELRLFVAAPAIPAANNNITCMFMGWLEPPYPNTE
jgi:hypothetical protein